MASVLPLPLLSSVWFTLLSHKPIFQESQPSIQILGGTVHNKQPAPKEHHQLPSMTLGSPTIHCPNKIIPSLWEALSTSCPNIIYDFKCCLIYGWNSPCSEEGLSNLLGMFLGNGGKEGNEISHNSRNIYSFYAKFKVGALSKKREKKKPNPTQTTLIW